MIPVDPRLHAAALQRERRMAMSEDELRKALVVARGTLARLRLRQDVAELRSTSTLVMQTARTGARAGALIWAVVTAAGVWRRIGRGHGSPWSRVLRALGIAWGFPWRLAGPAARPSPVADTHAASPYTVHRVPVSPMKDRS